MNNFIFHSPTKFVFGKDTEQKVGEIIKSYNAKNILMVYGGKSAERSGLLARVRQSCTDVSIKIYELGGIQPNPTDDRVYEGIEIAKRENIELVLAVGGGSVIDTAKAIAAGTLYEGDFWDFYEGKVIVQEALPVGVILTIPAAGSEGSGNSVITKLDGLHKISLRTESALRPKFAIMNPTLTFSLPPYQTACGIADMMVHIFERYFSNTNNSELTDRLCEATLTAIINEAPKVFANPEDYDARANIMWSGTIAHNGICGTGRQEDWSSHFIEHEISAVYNVAHGAGLSAIVPAWMTWMIEHNVSKVKQLAIRVFGVNEIGNDKDIAREGIARLSAFWKSIGLPVSLSQLGVGEIDIPLIAEKLHSHKGDKVGFYYPLSHNDTIEILSIATK